MSRKVAREVTMKLAYARLLGGDDEYETILEQAGSHAKPSPEDLDFSRQLLQGIEEHQKELDELIGTHAVGWSIDRIPRVDLCILRMALYEMLYIDSISESVSINEAVELGKRFGGEKSFAYINGVLGGVSKAK